MSLLLSDAIFLSLFRLLFLLRFGLADILRKFGILAGDLFLITILKKWKHFAGHHDDELFLPNQPLDPSINDPSLVFVSMKIHNDEGVMS